MLTGEKLGAAIEEARKKKGVTKKALAAHFGVSPPSIQDWVKRGTIDKDKLVALWEYFSDKVGPEHWGLPWHFSVQANPPPPDLATALPVVLSVLPGLDKYRAGLVLKALESAMESEPPPPLEVIADDLLRWLTEGPSRKRVNER